jgi:starvation-inducible DNA-binding protein
MELLVESMKKLLADAYAFQLKTNFFHWNVTGSDFLVYHDFFGKLYKDVFESTDEIAEQIRVLGIFAPGSFTRFKELTSISCETAIPTSFNMITILIEDNERVLESLNNSFRLANEYNKQGLADYLAGRIDVHNKHGWMLKSCIKV